MLAAFATCAADAECDDGGACTADRCTPHGCTSAFLPDGTSCGTDSPCLIHQCVAGLCNAAAGQGCDDGDPCTWDTCASDGTCAHGSVVGIAAVTCRFAAPALAACGGAVPREVSRRYAEARRLILRAADARGAAARRLARRGIGRLVHATAAARRARRRHEIAADCAAALAETLGGLRAAARVLLAG
jgi:hypothetical protein